jgi:hypothetical protein
MGVLRASLVLVVALSGCYSPAVRDCTVSCASPGDCASGQVCGSDGLCAAPGVAGRCASGPVDAAPDSGPGVRSDAGAIDAAAPDAALPVPLHVMITGKGSVLVDGQGACSSLGSQRGDCTYSLAPHVAQTVRAVPVQPDQTFAGWTSTTCSGQPAVCVFTPAAATTIVVQFEKK